MTDRTRCSIDACDRPASARGWCLAHYGRWYITGLEPAPTAIEPSDGRDPHERVWDHVDKSDGCWTWTGFTHKGYGRFMGQRAHAYVYELMVGPVPSGLVIDHLCRNRHCVNPAHLEPVTQGENIRRGHAARAG